jgi:hypothetical protein
MTLVSKRKVIMFNTNCIVAINDKGKVASALNYVPHHEDVGRVEI